MRCEICNAITENCNFDKDTGKMSIVCAACSGVINDTIGEDQQDDEDRESVEEDYWQREVFTSAQETFDNLDDYRK